MGPDNEILLDQSISLNNDNDNHMNDSSIQIATKTKIVMNHFNDYNENDNNDDDYYNPSYNLKHSNVKKFIPFSHHNLAINNDKNEVSLISFLYFFLLLFFILKLPISIIWCS